MFLSRTGIVILLAGLLGASCGPNRSAAPQPEFGTRTPLRELASLAPLENRNGIEIQADGERTLFLRLAGRSRLIFERVTAAASAAALRVDLRFDGSGEPVKHSVELDRLPVTIDLGHFAETTYAELSLEAIGSAVRIESAFLEGDFQPTVFADSRCLAPQPSQRPNIFVYLIDTLRSDHLGLSRGRVRSPTPEIDRFAEDSVVFEDAIAQSPWTRASVASLILGLEPNLHGVNDRHDAISDEATTLAELLAGAGYSTASFNTNGNASRHWGFAQGYQFFARMGKKGSEVLNERVFEYLDSTPAEPLFAYIHSIDPHAPYRPPEPFKERFAHGVDPELGEIDTLRRFLKEGRQPRLPDPDTMSSIRGLYDAEIARNDAQIGFFLERLRDLGLYDDSIVVLTSDHGEEFWEHDSWSHGQSLYYEQLQIPLVVKLPQQRMAGSRRRGLVQHIDIHATVLAAAGLDGAERSGGLPLPLCDARQPDPLGRPVFSVMELSGRKGAAVTTKNWKLIEVDRKTAQREFYPEVQLFDRIRDREEQRNLALERPFVAGYWQSVLRRHLAREGSNNDTRIDVVDPELEHELRELGYLDQNEGD